MTMTMTCGAWTIEIVKNGAHFVAVKGYVDASGFNAVRSLGSFKTLAGAERAGRRACA